jgi:hypothetical protein
MSKYHSKKIVVNGETFDSKKEFRKFCELSQLERVGEITGLQRQVKFVLIPAQREPDTVGKRGGIKKGKVIERELSYVADFVYYRNGKKIVEDSKGFRTPDYKIKKKLMLYFHNIQIKET